MNKIKFHFCANSPFFNSLNKDVELLIHSNSYLVKARRLLWIKMIFYVSLHLSYYAILYALPHTSLVSFILNYISIGLSGILLAFNVSHDACHGTF